MVGHILPGPLTLAVCNTIEVSFGIRRSLDLCLKRSSPPYPQNETVESLTISVPKTQAQKRRAFCPSKDISFRDGEPMAISRFREV